MIKFVGFPKIGIHIFTYQPHTNISIKRSPDLRSCVTVFHDEKLHHLSHPVMHRRQRDLRTAHEKWEQGIREAHINGWYQILGNNPPAGIFGGWDHTKKPNRCAPTSTTSIEI